MTQAAWSDPSFEAAARLVASRTGLNTAPHRRAYVENCMRRAMAREGLRSPADYVLLLAGEGRPLDELVNEITIQESYFFREPGQLDVIRRTILPALRRAGRPVQLWSAGCAGGEEAYTLAIMLEQEGMAETAAVLGTDISRRALAKARAGRYTPWALRASDRAFINRYFLPGAGEREIAPRFRDRTRFDYLNLAAESYPPRLVPRGSMDLILCRNVFIYFGAETVARIAENFRASLAEGGWLVTGSSDPLLPSLPGLARTATAAGIFYQRRDGRAEAAPPAPDVFPLAPAPPPLPAAPRRAPAAAPPARPAPAPKPSQAQADERAAEIRRLADGGDREAAARAAEQAAAAFPMAAEIHFLHALVLIDLGRPAEALQAVRRVIYLDRGLAFAHWLHGIILERLDGGAGARESRAAFGQALRLLQGRPADEIVPLSDGETAGGLVRVLSGMLGGDGGAEAEAS